MAQKRQKPRDPAEQKYETELIERCKRGEMSAFDELVSHYEKRVFNFAYRIAGNYDDANDVAQKHL